MKHKFFILSLIFLSLTVFNCTEKFELKTEDFEDVLVVEATFTDEFKKHEIKISRTFLLEDNAAVIERNANVKIIDSDTNEFVFLDYGNGIYVSDIAFQAVEDVSYQLIINTEDGKEYISNEEFLPKKATIDNLYPELVDIGTDYGVQLFVDTNEDLGDAQFFRYEYEETYKVIAPYFSGTETQVSNYQVNYNGNITYNISVFPNPNLAEVCYATNYSGIILTNKDAITGNSLTRFPVKYISQDNFSVFKTRYSILVKQYVQSANANNFYRILKELGGDVSLLLDNQPGFIKGNINSQQSEKEKVIGYFDVSSVDSKRIYFNYEDLGIDLPSYFIDCNVKSLDQADENQNSELYSDLVGGYTVFDHPAFTVLYTIVKKGCADCSPFGSSIKPEFWED
jgi:hypothetical protein